MVGFKKIIFTSLILFALVSSTIAQDEDLDSETKIKYTKEFAAFIPKDFRFLDCYVSDLNQDSLKDVFLIVEYDTSIAEFDSTYEFDETCRPIIILIKQQNGELKQVARNNFLLSGRACGGMFGLYFFYPYITVGNGYFGIEHFYFHCGGAHSETTITFKYKHEKDDWFLELYDFSQISDTPLEDGDYGDSTGSFGKTSKDFGIISINNYTGEEVYEK